MILYLISLFRGSNLKLAKNTHLYSVSQAIGLAKLIKDKHHDSKPRPQRFLTPQTTCPTTNSPILSNNKSTVNPHINHPLPIKRLTPNQLQKRRALGLCYNCDEKFTQGIDAPLLIFYFSWMTLAQP